MRWRERKIWVRSWIQRRMQQGAYQNLVQELALEDKEMYKNYFRISLPLEKAETYNNVVIVC